MSFEEMIKKSVFKEFKKSIDMIISQENDENIAEEPIVNIEAVAKKQGITDIQQVSPIEMKRVREEFFNKHAFLMGTVIFLNNEDSPEKQRFSIAHEIFHHISKIDTNDDMLAVARQGEAWKKENAGSVKAVEEIIADFFAANLLIPTERFILHDEKSDEDIARIFGVEAKCIRKRREEIELEIELLTPRNLSSDIIIEDKTPLSLNELNNILEGHCANEGQA
ncbi:MAG: ImmA/IrrE family metallo-endopeptidase [Treponema sp.]|nr:ImmA/IrrE family metallo-endopeptidase [Treponema sp.]